MCLFVISSVTCCHRTVHSECSITFLLKPNIIEKSVRSHLDSSMYIYKHSRFLITLNASALHQYHEALRFSISVRSALIAKANIAVPADISLNY